MIFSTGLKKIYEAISRQPEAKRESLLNNLHEKLGKNEALAHKFEILNLIQENKGKFSKEGAQKFFALLEKKHNSFLKGNDQVAVFYKEEKALFEYYNINQKEIISEKLDLIVNKKDNKLNESVILGYITDANKRSVKDMVNESKEFYKEYYTGVKATRDEEEFEKSIERLKVESAKLPTSERKALVEKAIKSVHNESFTNFDSAVEKLYKLRVLNEKFILEYFDDEEEELDNYEADMFGDEEEEIPVEPEEDINIKKFLKSVKIDDTPLFKKVVALVPKDFDVDYAEISFVVDFYPIQPKMADIMAEVGILKRKVFPRLIRPLKLAVHSKAKQFFESSDAIMSTELAISSPIPGKPIKWKFYIKLNVNEDARVSSFPKLPNGQADLVAGYKAGIEVVLADFEAALSANSEIAAYLTPEAMTTAMANATAGRKSTYTKRDAKDKYYTDKRQGNGKAGWEDNFMRGDARDASDEPMSNDWEKNIDSGQGIMPGSVESEDDRIDREAQAAAGASAAKRKKPTIVKKA